MKLTVAQAAQIIDFCIRTHDELWDVNQGDEVSMAFADGTTLSAPGHEIEGFLERAETAALFLMEP